MLATPRGGVRKAGFRVGMPISDTGRCLAKSIRNDVFFGFARVETAKCFGYHEGS
jgi:hypothetical protein